MCSCSADTICSWLALDKVDEEDTPVADVEPGLSVRFLEHGRRCDVSGAVFKGAAAIGAEGVQSVGSAVWGTAGGCLTAALVDTGGRLFELDVTLVELARDRTPGLHPTPPDVEEKPFLISSLSGTSASSGSTSGRYSTPGGPCGRMGRTQLGF